MGADWVRGVLTIRSGELVVLVPARAAGFRVVYENVGNNFHLFTLLHAALGPELGVDIGDREPAIAAARGEAAADGSVTDTALWDFCHYGAAAPGGAGMLAWVWGEASVASIPRLDGEQVLVLAPVTASRSWNGGFFGPQLHQCPTAANVVGRLDPGQVDQWIHRAAAASAAIRKEGK